MQILGEFIEFGAKLVGALRTMPPYSLTSFLVLQKAVQKVRAFFIFLLIKILRISPLITKRLRIQEVTA